MSIHDPPLLITTKRRFSNSSSNNMMLRRLSSPPPSGPSPPVLSPRGPNLHKRKPSGSESKLLARRITLEKTRRLSGISDSSSDPQETLDRNSTKKDKKKGWWDVYEVPRKVLHSSIGIVTLGLYCNRIPVTYIIYTLLPSLVIIGSADILRLHSPKFERTYERLLGPLMRESEKKGPNGVIFYLIGVLTVLSTLPLDIATLSILILSWCDTAASVFGRMYGRYTPSLPSPPFGAKKSLAGCLGASAAGALSALIFFPISSYGNLSDLSWSSFTLPPRDLPLAPTWIPMLPRPDSTMPLWVLTVACGAIGAVSEAIDFGGADDNLTIPIIAGALIWALLRFW